MDEARRTDATSIPMWSFSEFGMRATRQWLDRGECLAGVLMDWNTEVTQFVSRRIGQNSETISRISRCQGLGDALDIEAQWMRGTLEDYFTETKKLLAFNSKVFEDLMGTRAERSEPNAPSIRPASRRQQSEKIETAAA